MHTLEWFKKKKEQNTLSHSVEHLQKIKETVIALYNVIRNLDDKEKKREYLHLVAQREHEADDIRKDITQQIVKGHLIFSGYEDLLEFVYEADSIADWAHAADRYLALFEGAFTEDVKTSLLRIAEFGVKCVTKLAFAVEQLATASKDEVLTTCAEIETLEEVADDEKRELLRAIFRGNYSAAEMIILRDLTEAIEDICDRCEISADRIRILTPQV